MLVRLIDFMVKVSILLIAMAVNAAEPVTKTFSEYGPVSYADAVAKAAPAVVSIQTTKHIPLEQHPLLQDPFFRFRFFGDPNFLDEIPEQEQLQQGLGSGVIINSKGYVLTNNHVIKGADQIIVKLPDNRTAEAIIVGTDPQTDLAVLKINLANLPAINLGVSAKLRVGDIVLAIGNPFGFERTVTQGIVSAVGSITARTHEKVVESVLLDNLIQTDAAINPGNSGGALIDVYGNLIGINMAIISKTGASHGIGFAIPIDTAKDIMGQLIAQGHITRGWIGVALADLTPGIQRQLNFNGNEGGVYVQGTFNNSPARRAGILPGDIIVNINKTPINNSTAAIKLVTALVPGKPYHLKIYRRGNYLTISVVIGKRPQEQ